MGSWLSKNKSTVTKVVSSCSKDETALKQLLSLANTVTDSESIREFYLKSVEYVECNSVNANLLKEEIFNYYQDAIIEEAKKLTTTYKDWQISGETDEEQLQSVQDRMIDLQKDIVELNEALKYYSRDDTQGADLLNEIQELQISTLSQLKSLSEAVDVFKARYLFGTIICNYCCGDIGNVNSTAELKIINNYLTLNSYKGCLMFSEFQPLLWPTDYDWEDNNTTQKAVSDEFLEKYISSGIPSENLKNLSNYYSNYYFVKYEAFNSTNPNTEFTNNTFSIPYPNATETFADMSKKVKDFVEDSKIKTWKEFFTKGKEVLKKFDIHHFKMLPYMAHKKHLLTNGEFMRIPETYPKYDRDIELFEAVISIMNVCFANCGVRENSDDNTKIIGAYTYNDLGLNTKYSTYFDSRAFVIGDFTNIENSTKTLVNASNLNTEGWNDFTLTLSANTSAEPGFNSTGYFSDRIYNCLDNSKNVKADSEFPSIDGLSALRVVKAKNSEESKTQKENSEESKESFENFAEHVKIAEGVNSVALEYFNNVIKLPSTSVLYSSNNNKLYSSIDYMTMDTDSYSENPAIPYYIYFNFVPKSLSFEIVIPLNTTRSTMSICTNDIRGGCEQKYLIPLAFVGSVDNGLINDPLFNIYNFDNSEGDDSEDDNAEGDNPEGDDELNDDNPEEDEVI